MLTQSWKIKTLISLRLSARSSLPTQRRNAARKHCRHWDHHSLSLQKLSRVRRKKKNHPYLNVFWEKGEQPRLVPVQLPESPSVSRWGTSCCRFGPVDPTLGWGLRYSPREARGVTAWLYTSQPRLVTCPWDALNVLTFCEPVPQSRDTKTLSCSFSVQRLKGHHSGVQVSCPGCGCGPVWGSEMKFWIGVSWLHRHWPGECLYMTENSRKEGRAGGERARDFKPRCGEIYYSKHHWCCSWWPKCIVFLLPQTFFLKSF